MSEFTDKLKNDFKDLGFQFKTLWAKITKKPAPKKGAVVVSSVATTYEVSLVPAVKAQMIKAQKMRNIVLFICIVVSSVAVGVVLILSGIKGGQDIALASKDNKLNELSSKLADYTELSDLVTIQGQLNVIDELIGQKKVVSRVFGAVGVMLSQGDDYVALSELQVNTNTGQISLEAQADAKTAPFIDYRVLESFKKGVALTKYDYGRFVDADGNTLPTRCIKEADENGNAYKTGDSYFAWWDLLKDGCKGAEIGLKDPGDAKFRYVAGENQANVERVAMHVDQICDERGENCEDPVFTKVDMPTSVDEGGNLIIPEDVVLVDARVKVWRTPQFSEWYKEGHMSLDGEISGIQHFVSSCYQYSGSALAGSKDVRWTSNNECMLAEGGFEVTSSTNGRDESDNLVLKFSGKATLAKAFFDFNNKHMIAIGPMGQNVTDSYIQIGGMFTQEARECEEGDSECLTNNTNKGEQ